MKKRICISSPRCVAARTEILPDETSCYICGGKSFEGMGGEAEPDEPDEFTFSVPDGASQSFMGFELEWEEYQLRKHPLRNVDEWHGAWVAKGVGGVSAIRVPAICHSGCTKAVLIAEKLRALKKLQEIISP